MKQLAPRLYRLWRSLNHQGLTDDTYEGYRKFERAEAIGILVAAAPMIPLIVSDQMGFERGWLFYGWSAFAWAWLIGVFGTILYQTCRSLAGYSRAWRDKSR